MLPTMVDFVRLLIMKNARSYATNHGGPCMATDNGTHVVSLPTMLGNSFEVYRHLQGTNGVKGEK